MQIVVVDGKCCIAITKKVDNIGRIVIPVDFVRALNMQTHQKLDFIMTDDGLLVKKSVIK